MRKLFLVLTLGSLVALGCEKAPEKPKAATGGEAPKAGGGARPNRRGDEEDKPAPKADAPKAEAPKDAPKKDDKK